MPRHVRLLLLLFLGALQTGCPAIQWYTKQSSKGAVRGFYEGVAEIEQPLRGRAMAQVLNDPVLRQMAHDVTASVVTGAVDGLTEAKLNKLSEHMVEDSMRTLREQGTEAMQKFMNDAGPMLEQAMRHGIENSILTVGEAMRKSAQNDMGEATNLLVRAAVDGMLVSLRRGSHDLFRDLSVDTEQYLAGKVAPSAGLVARTVTREAVLGLQDGFTQPGMHEQLPALRMVMREIGIGLGEGLGQGLGHSVRKSPLEPILIGLSAGLTLLFVTALVWLILLWRRYVHVTQSIAEAPIGKLDLGHKSDELDRLT